MDVPKTRRHFRRLEILIVFMKSVQALLQMKYTRSLHCASVLLTRFRPHCLFPWLHGSFPSLSLSQITRGLPGPLHLRGMKKSIRRPPCGTYKQHWSSSLATAEDSVTQQETTSKKEEKSLVEVCTFRNAHSRRIKEGWRSQSDPETHEDSNSIFSAIVFPRAGVLRPLPVSVPKKGDDQDRAEGRQKTSLLLVFGLFEKFDIKGRNRKESKRGRQCIHSSGTNLTFRTKPVPLWFRCQSQTLSVINPGTELTAKDLAFLVTNPAVEIISSILRYNINRVCGEWLLHIVKWTMS